MSGEETSFPGPKQPLNLETVLDFFSVSMYTLTVRWFFYGNIFFQVKYGRKWFV